MRVEEDDYFVERDDLDLYTEADLSVGQAVLGGELREAIQHEILIYYAFIYPSLLHYWLHLRMLGRKQAKISSSLPSVSYGTT